MEFSAGQVLVGKYRVERLLGRGGMGVVVAAHHLQLDEKVAIKFLLPEAVGNVEVVERFVREARAAVRIKSEHVARVSDVGTLDGGEPYMVMEHLEGSDLAAWLERGPLPVEQAVEFVLQAGEAIAEAHALGIVHRDLKPANLFVVRRADGLWSVKVLDFGISKVTARGESQRAGDFTRTAAVMGSPLYMPPEQMVASKTVDARSDIWALGVILYELMTGQAPFAGDTLPEVCMRIALEAPRSLGTFRPEIPPTLEAVVLRCLEKDRERRYSNVADLAHALVEFAPTRARNSVDRIARTIQAAGLSVSTFPLPQPAPAGHPEAGSNAKVGAGTDAPWGRTTSGRRKNKRPFFILLGGLLVVALGALAIGSRRGSSSSEASIATSATVPVSTDSGALTAAVFVSPSAPIASATASTPAVLLPLPTAAPAASAAMMAKGFPRREQGSSVESTGPAKHSNIAPTTTPSPTPKAPAKKPNIFDDR